MIREIEGKLHLLFELRPQLPDRRTLRGKTLWELYRANDLNEQHMRTMAQDFHESGDPVDYAYLVEFVKHQRVLSKAIRRKRFTDSVKDYLFSLVRL